jgi:LTXXQ motif family protein
MKIELREVFTLFAVAFLIVATIPVMAQAALSGSAQGTRIDEARPSTQSHSNVLISPPISTRSRGTSNARARGPITENELLSGLNLSDEQKAAIDRIHHEMRAKMDIVTRDENETPEQKSAMLEGMNRMQVLQVYDVLKPEQREAARKRISTIRAANRQQGDASPQRKSQ